MSLNHSSRIALISIDYPPLCTSAAVQMRDLAQEMVNQGYNPLVITPCSDIDVPWKSEVLDGVRVLRLAAQKTRDVGYIRRAIVELFLPFLMYYRLRKSPFHNVCWDLVVWYSPTIFFGPLVWMLKLHSKCKTYLILRDIFPEWALDLGLLGKGVPYHFFKMFANLQYAIADTIGIQSPSNIYYLSHWVKKYEKKVEVLKNWLSPAPYIGTSINLSETILSGKKIMVYIGNMGIAQGMDIFIDLAENLQDRTDIGFLFVGRGSETLRLKETIKKKKIKNTLFFDEVDSSEMPGLLSQCHVGLLTLDPRHKTHNIPGKFLTYLFAGLPVLARVNPGTDLAHIINSECVGFAYEGELIAPMRKFIEDILADQQNYKKFAANAEKLSSCMFSTSRAVNQIGL